MSSSTASASASASAFAFVSTIPPTFGTKRLKPEFEMSDFVSKKLKRNDEFSTHWKRKDPAAFVNYFISLTEEGNDPEEAMNHLFCDAFVLKDVPKDESETKSKEATEDELFEKFLKDGADCIKGHNKDKKIVKVELILADKDFVIVKGNEASVITALHNVELVDNFFDKYELFQRFRKGAIFYQVEKDFPPEKAKELLQDYDRKTINRHLDFHALATAFPGVLIINESYLDIIKFKRKFEAPSFNDKHKHWVAFRTPTKMIKLILNLTFDGVDQDDTFMNERKEQREREKEERKKEKEGEKEGEGEGEAENFVEAEMPDA
jgi:hypothetical protein